jgi:hypothetical protein
MKHPRHTYGSYLRTGYGSYLRTGYDMSTLPRAEG